MPHLATAAQPIFDTWNARLGLDFDFQDGKSILAAKRFEGPLVVQKPLYPEGAEVCHAIVVHPPAGIAGGDALTLTARVEERAAALLTTPGAAKWYRSAGPWAKQEIVFEVAGSLEWLPRETIVFNGALAELESRIELKGGASYVGWEVLCLGRSGSGERFERGEIRLVSSVSRDGRPVWMERGRIEGGGRLMRSPAGLAGRTVAGTFVAASVLLEKEILSMCREKVGGAIAITLLPGVLLGRYLGDSSEEAMEGFARLWELLRPALTAREALRPRIWST